MTISCGLIAGRHKLPDYVKDYVFRTDIPQTHICDSAYLDRICTDFLDKHPNADMVCVYVTGFTPAMLALVKACSARKIHLMAMNYDRENRNFWSQEVI